MRIVKESETKSFICFREITTDTKLDVEKSRLEKAVEELKVWQANPHATFFTAQLYNLVCKADCENQKKLLQGFPARMAAYLLWYNSTDKEAFYNEYLYLTDKEQKNEDIDY